jgi:hypothetical protein
VFAVDKGIPFYLRHWLGYIFFSWHYCWELNRWVWRCTKIRVTRWVSTYQRTRILYWQLSDCEIFVVLLCCIVVFQACSFLKPHTRSIELLLGLATHIPPRGFCFIALPYFFPINFHTLVLSYTLLLFPSCFIFFRLLPTSCHQIWHNVISYFFIMYMFRHDLIKLFFSCIFFSKGWTAPWGPRPPHFSRLHDHTLFRHTTLGRTALDEWSARRRDLYLTTHNTHNRQTSMPPAYSNPRSQ